LGTYCDFGIVWKIEQAIKPFPTNEFSRKGEKRTLEAAVATLLLVVASVVLACTVVTYAVTTIEQTVNTKNMPELTRLENFENSLLNSTYAVNGTAPQLPTPTTP
jgi:predicted PurR-regulated permease PerM